LKDVHYISSAGVGALIENKNNASKGGGDVYLANLDSDVKKVFDLLGFSNFFQIFNSPEDAAKKFS
jgi:anti-anti-sigma factor